MSLNQKLYAAAHFKINLDQQCISKVISCKTIKLYSSKRR